MKEISSNSMEEFVSSFDHYEESFTTARNEGLIEGAKQFTGISSVGEAVQTLEEASIAVTGAGGVSVATQAASKIISAVSDVARAIKDMADRLSGRGTNPLSEAGRAPDRGGLTKAGRALEKHGGREGSVFPKATGNVEAKNAQGQKILDEILSSKNQMTRSNRFGGQDIFDTITERGVRYDSNSNMMGFLDP